MKIKVLVVSLVVGLGACSLFTYQPPDPNVNKDYPCGNPQMKACIGPREGWCCWVDEVCVMTGGTEPGCRNERGLSAPRRQLDGGGADLL